MIWCLPRIWLRIEYDSAALVLKTISDRECHTLYTSINDCRSLMFADWNCHLVHVCQRNHILQDPHSSFMFTVIICLFHHVYHAWNNLFYVLLCLIHSLNHQTHGKFKSLCVICHVYYWSANQREIIIMHQNYSRSNFTVVNWKSVKKATIT